MIKLKTYFGTMAAETNARKMRIHVDRGRRKSLDVAVCGQDFVNPFDLWIHVVDAVDGVQTRSAHVLQARHGLQLVREAGVEVRDFVRAQSDAEATAVLLRVDRRAPLLLMRGSRVQVDAGRLDLHDRSRVAVARCYVASIERR